MSEILIRQSDITLLRVDAVVNAANTGLLQGGGVCGAIFAAAGAEELTSYCKKIGHCDVGNAVITPGGKLKARYVIHAVGPRWTDGQQGEQEQLYRAYRSALERAREAGCRSVAVPLISAGIYGCPVEISWQQGIRACEEFFAANPSYNLQVAFAVPDKNNAFRGEDILKHRRMERAKKAENFDYLLTAELDQRARLLFMQNRNLLIAIAEDETLSSWFRNYSAYMPCPGYEGLRKVLNESFRQKAYDYGIVLPEYTLILKRMESAEVSALEPTPEWAMTLTKVQLLACIAAQFRADHFSEGSFMKKSLGEGKLLPLMDAYLRKCGLL